jgi:hypothetical protein
LQRLRIAIHRSKGTTLKLLFIVPFSAAASLCSRIGMQAH